MQTPEELLEELDELAANDQLHLQAAAIRADRVTARKEALEWVQRLHASDEWDHAADFVGIVDAEIARLREQGRRDSPAARAGQGGGEMQTPEELLIKIYDAATLVDKRRAIRARDAAVRREVLEWVLRLHASDEWDQTADFVGIIDAEMARLEREAD